MIATGGSGKTPNESSNFSSPRGRRSGTRAGAPPELAVQERRRCLPATFSDAKAAFLDSSIPWRRRHLHPVRRTHSIDYRAQQTSRARRFSYPRVGGRKLLSSSGAALPKARARSLRFACTRSNACAGRERSSFARYFRELLRDPGPDQAPRHQRRRYHRTSRSR